jgi:hypothetical protein
LKHKKQFSAIEPKRVILKTPIAKRCALLGNSIVPDLVYHVLATFVEVINNPVMSKSKSTDIVLHTSNGFVCKPIRSIETQCTPLHFKDQHGTEYTRVRWVTPRKTAAAWSVGSRLTEQSMKKLATQVVYEKKTFTPSTRKNLLNYTVNPEFVE